MRRLGLLLAVACAVACSAVAPAFADDASSTAAYLRADYRLVQTGVASIPRVRGTLHALLAHVRRECPAAAAGSPQDPQSTQLSNEVIGAMVLSVVALNRPAGRAFVTATRGLSWSDRSLTGAVHAYAARVAALVAMRPPDLCADVRAWAASGFTALPASTLAFSPAFMANWVALGEQPVALARFETPADRSLAARAAHLESLFTAVEAEEVETWGHITTALDLWP